MLTPFEHSNHVAKYNIPEKLELWTAATTGQTITPRVDFPAQYAGRVYWQISDGVYKPVTSGAEISHTFAANGPHRVRLIGVPIDQITTLNMDVDSITKVVNAEKLTGYFSASGNTALSLPLRDLRNCTQVHLFNCDNAYGDLSDLIACTTINLAECAKITGSVADVPSTINGYVYLNHCGSITAGSVAHLLDITILRLQDNGWLAANVDTVIESIWDARASFTYATPVLNIGGTNAPPTGTYAAPSEGSNWHDDSGTWIPLTGNAMVYDLVNDVNSEGFNQWTITTS